MLFDYQTKVAAAVRDDATKLTSDDIDNAIAEAVVRYSKDRPRQKVADVTAPGGNLLPLPLLWEAGFSQVDSLEYPIGDIPPTLITQGAWAMYESPTGTNIQVIESIALNQVVRVNFTIAHVLGGAVDTIPVGDREAVASYASAILLDQLASLYSNDQDSTIKADSVQHISKAGEFARRAKTLRQRYFDDLGIDTKRNAAAGVVVNLSMSNSVGRDRLTHPRRYR